MNTTKKTANRRKGFTLVELIVVIGIILVIAALAAAFAPRVSDSQNLTRGVDSLEQWLLTAKMRAKRDQLATGLRFIPDPVNPGMFSEFQYIQQPDPLSGGWTSATGLNGGILTLAQQSGGTTFVTFGNVDFSVGGTPAQNQWLVQPGDFLEIRDGGVYFIGGVVPPAAGQPATTLQLSNSAYASALTITSPTTNYRILRQARILVGESPLNLPNNFAVDTTLGGNVAAGPSGFLEILFSPSGAVIGANAANGKILMLVHDITQTPFDPNKAGIVAVQTRTGFIGAYSVAAGSDPFFFAEGGRESGL